MYCRECRRDLDILEFKDEDGRYSTRCRECREKETTDPQTPYSRKASGLVDVSEVNRLLREKQEEARLRMSEEDTLPPPPDTEKK